ncbi:MAG TPA: hypothetical protein VFM70_00720 [Salinimicrobium sp.]|nr:hypothetical protein [Salinimicrobium sp.]
MKKNIFLAYIALSSFTIAQAQIGIGTTNPKSETLLDIESEDGEKGVLIPRVNLQDLNTLDPITSSTGTAAESLLVYNRNTTTGPGFFYWNGTDQWVPVGDSKMTGDIKHSFINSDHKGWYLLDGRSINSLPVNAKNAAIALGFLTNLPDATDRFLKGKSGSETSGEQKGSNSITLTQNNLPNFNMTATTTTQVGHDHDFTDFGAVVNIEENVLETNESNGNSFPVAEWNDNGVSSNTETAGEHNHSVTVNSGGNGTPINATPASIVTNIFIYLG